MFLRNPFLGLYVSLYFLFSVNFFLLNFFCPSSWPFCLTPSKNKINFLNLFIDILTFYVWAVVVVLYFIVYCSRIYNLKISIQLCFFVCFENLIRRMDRWMVGWSALNNVFILCVKIPVLCVFFYFWQAFLPHLYYAAFFGIY